MKPAATIDQALSILALNCGSSSLKFGLYRVAGAAIETLLYGQAESIGSSDTVFHAYNTQHQPLICERVSIPTSRDALVHIGRLLSDLRLPAPLGIGHRIVHGGANLRQPCLVNDAVLVQLKAAAAFAPLHMPAALAVISDATEHFPGLPQVCCFDTGFHVGMPELACVLPLPKHLRADGMQRYGFHGLSCESILRQLADPLPDRVIIAHLGNGASITAIKSGKSIDTSMGLTPTGGVIMGTRSGDLDPGLLLYLLRERHLDADRLEQLVNQESGLLGISALSSDMRRLHADSASNPDARLAIAMFCRSISKQIAAIVAVLNGLDLMVFTGGIGENDAVVRSTICGDLSWLGISLDASRNASMHNPISSADARCQIQVLASNEDEQIALHTAALVRTLF